MLRPFDRSRLSRILSVAVITLGLVAVGAAIGVASHEFTDVPDGNIFHDDIDAIADARVTLGCNPPANDEYCPDDFVTREQMAAFMNRLGAFDGGKEPVVDARTVQGFSVHADIVEIEVDNQENNEEECEATTSLLGVGHPFGSFFITYQLLGTPDAVFTFDVNVAASDREPEEIDDTGEFLICFATIDGSELPDGTYTLFAIEAHEMDPIS